MATLGVFERGCAKKVAELKQGRAQNAPSCTFGEAVICLADADEE